jgi:hypothetical protein
MMEIKYLPVSRVLSPLEIQLFSYLGNERQSIQLARVIGSLPEDADHNVIEQAVTKALVTVLERRGLFDTTEYMGGRLINRWREEQ